MLRKENPVRPKQRRRARSRLARWGRMAAYRRRLREQGLRPVQLWVPDT